MNTSVVIDKRSLQHCAPFAGLDLFTSEALEQLWQDVFSGLWVTVVPKLGFIQYSNPQILLSSVIIFRAQRFPL